MELQNKIQGIAIPPKWVEIWGAETHLGQVKPRGIVIEIKPIMRVPYKINMADDQIVTPKRNQERTTLLMEEKLKEESAQDTWINLDWSHIQETQKHGGKWI